MKDYLTLRKQLVAINGEFSEWGDIEAGVPQGSILGPLLFFACVNDIVNCVNFGITIFADDTILHLEFDNPLLATDILNEKLSNISSWAHRWLVTFSPEKNKSHIHIIKKHLNIC